MDKLITIVGPTAVGKTELTLSLADYFGSPVISGDAYQVYRGFTIGTAKPTDKELIRTKHYLIDILDSNAPYSVAQFKEAAEDIIRVCNNQGEVPILSGGTGLYVQALLEDYQFSEIQPDRALREKLDDLFAETGKDGLLTYAQKLAKPLGITLHFTDKHRLYRAIEMMVQGDVNSLQGPRKNGLVYDGPVIGLRRSRQDLYERINLRVDMMIENGLFAEIEHLLDAGISADSQAFKAIGYKETLAYFKGLVDKDTVIEEIKKNTRRFAKRQLTWYRRMPYIQWLDIDENTDKKSLLTKALEIIKKTQEEGTV